ncbi:hypothetical protein [Albimonas pacifica]|uniref:Uncharacterized protein n=1 Tax=Albimonas pacifica TaxID=1114924 RepID=A0A1I3FUZ4_9RHOB|nr:hypothetical protein [Albimonas pacifica]SFI15063.1 hypothetical protein SAMN05216258_104536 [Albimonas pacifica]
MRLNDPYNRIMRAAKAGKGVRLSADEVWDLHLDDAIATRAHFLQEEEEARRRATKDGEGNE